MTLIQVKESTKQKFILTSEHVLWAATLLALAAGIVYFFFDLEQDGILATCIIVSLLTTIVTRIWGSFEYFPDQYDAVGPVVLSFTEIKTLTQIYPLSEIKMLSFHVNDFKGKKMGNSFEYNKLSGPTLSQGINNYIRFKSGEIDIEIQFLLRSEMEIGSLADFLTNLYKQGYDFDEFNEGSKSYGLEHPRTYAETQEFKKIWPRKVGKRK